MDKRKLLSTAWPSILKEKVLSKSLEKKLKDFWKNIKGPTGQYRGSKATVNKPKFKGTLIQVGNLKLELFPQDYRYTKTAF